MDEYIKRAAIMEFPIRKDHCDKERANEHFIFGIESVLEYVQNLPAADVAPVVHGAWIDFYGDHKTAECSKCQQLFEVTFDGPGKPEFFAAFQDFYRYCPNCGARMDGGKNEANQC